MKTFVVMDPSNGYRQVTADRLVMNNEVAEFWSQEESALVCVAAFRLRQGGAAFRVEVQDIEKFQGQELGTQAAGLQMYFALNEAGQKQVREYFERKNKITI